MNLKTRLERLETYLGHVDGIACLVLYPTGAGVRRWSGRIEWLSLADAQQYVNDPAVKGYKASADFDPEALEAV